MLGRRYMAAVCRSPCLVLHCHSAVQDDAPERNGADPEVLRWHGGANSIGSAMVAVVRDAIEQRPFSRHRPYPPDHSGEVTLDRRCRELPVGLPCLEPPAHGPGDRGRTQLPAIRHASGALRSHFLSRPYQHTT